MTEPITEANGQSTQVSDQEHAVNMFIWTSITCMMGGIRAALPHVPLSILVVKICSAFGAYIGQSVCIGMIGEVLKVRTACTEAFREGVKGTPIQPPPMQTGQKLNG